MCVLVIASETAGDISGRQKGDSGQEQEERAPAECQESFCGRGNTQDGRWQHTAPLEPQGLTGKPGDEAALARAQLKPGRCLS